MGSVISIGPQSNFNVHTFRTSVVEDEGLVLPESDTEQDFADVYFGQSSGKRPQMQPVPNMFFIKYSDISETVDSRGDHTSEGLPKKSLISSTHPEYINVRPVGDFLLYIALDLIHFVVKA